MTRGGAHDRVAADERELVVERRSAGDGSERAPWPLARGAFAPGLERLAAGEPFKASLEALLLALDDAPAARLMQLLREGRGAWLALLETGGGEALFVGNALSGTVTALARHGFRVTVVDDAPERARFAAYRDRAHAPGRTASVLCDGPTLPFADGAFDLVVREEGGLPGALGVPVDECLRLAAREVVWIADNRLAYKRPRGRHDVHRVQDPLRWARAAVAPGNDERTLPGYRRALERDGWRPARAFALYPHAKQFYDVAALDGAWPELIVGPKERQNRVKLAAKSLGLFPIFTPSFALIASRAPTAPRAATTAATSATRIERVLDALAERTGEPRGRVQHLLGTRGNSAVVQTVGPDAAGADLGSGPGRWTLHVPLCPKNRPQLEVHHRALVDLPARFLHLPLPEPLFVGEVDGIWLTCERRLAGLPAHQHCGDPARMARTLREASQQLAGLVVAAPAPFDEHAFDEQIATRIDRAARFAAVPSTIANLARLKDELRERLLGRALPRVAYHADLRAKHVQVDADGGVLGYLDWGTLEPAEIPYLDLLHLVVHERKQEADLTAEAAWRLMQRRDALRDHEREALESYARVVGIDEETRAALELFYPASVAAMAEKNWDYSRPRWLHRQFGV
jgi:hypothetical protein